jgi:hypothetical protein
MGRRQSLYLPDEIEHTQGKSKDLTFHRVEAAWRRRLGKAPDGGGWATVWWWLHALFSGDGVATASVAWRWLRALFLSSDGMARTSGSFPQRRRCGNGVGGVEIVPWISAMWRREGAHVAIASSAGGISAAWLLRGSVKLSQPFGGWL